MRWVIFVAALLTATAFAGCASDSGTDPTGTGTSGTTSGSKSSSGTTSRSGTATGTTTSRSGTATGTTSADPNGHTVDLSSDVQAGTAPLSVTFGLSASEGAESWELVFGDGTEAATGTAPVPSSQPHTYSIGGNFTATLTVFFDDKESSQDMVGIQVGVPDTGEPPETHFEYGPGLGCEGSVEQGTCISFVAGPAQPAVDGYWQPVDSRYWGRSFTTTIEPPVPGDSDCYFVAPDATTILGDAANGSSTCEGTVPNGAGWIFLYSYGVPEQAMTMDFQ